GGVQHRVLRERTEPAGRCAEHRVPDGEALGPLADGGDDPRGLEPHRQRQTATGPERALPPLPVGGAHAGGADLDPDLPAARGRPPAPSAPSRRLRSAGFAPAARPSIPISPVRGAGTSRWVSCWPSGPP